MAPRNPLLSIGDVVQIDPDYHDFFGGAFMIVSEIKPFGAVGYVPVGTYMVEQHKNSFAVSDKNEEGRSLETLPIVEIVEIAEDEGETPERLPGSLYIRVPWESMEFVGPATWTCDNSNREDSPT